VAASPAKSGASPALSRNGQAPHQVTPSPRNAEAVMAIARWLHPSAFALPADGS